MIIPFILTLAGAGCLVHISRRRLRLMAAECTNIVEVVYRPPLGPGTHPLELQAERKELLTRYNKLRKARSRIITRFELLKNKNTPKGMELYSQIMDKNLAMADLRAEISGKFPEVQF